MIELPKSSPHTLPLGLSLESPGTNLASLSMTASMLQLTSTVIRQWKSPEAFKPLAKYGIHPVRQLLFYGPPGNGKTSACQWLAQTLYVPLYRVRCETLVGSFLGHTAANVAKVMEWMRDQPPAVVLFDEVESLFPSRSDGGGQCARELNAAMTVYWQYLDRWKGQHLFVLATNLVERLDKALVSRIELQLEFGPPTEAQTREVIAYWREALHEYGPDVWAAQLLERLDEGRPFVSFRALWQEIQRGVVVHVDRTLGGDA